MKIRTSTVLLGVDGEPLADAGKPVSLRAVIQNALLGTLRGDENLSGTEKLALWGLATRANEAEADFSVEEMATIKERIGRAYGPVVVGPVYEILDPS